MTHPDPNLAAHQLDQAALRALRAYLNAVGENRPYPERYQLAREWMRAARRKRDNCNRDYQDEVGLIPSFLSKE